MLLPSSVGSLFSDSLFVDLDLQRLQDYYHTIAHLTPSPQSQPHPQHSLMTIVREPELLEQDLLPFAPSVTAPIAHLPPGKLPGVVVPAATTLSTLFADASLPTGIGVKQPPPPSSESPTKKRTKTEHITIEHF